MTFDLLDVDIRNQTFGFTPTAEDNNRVVTPTVSCTPPSGSMFYFGETHVECIATDAADLMGYCDFFVIVRLPCKCVLLVGFLFGWGVGGGVD